MPRQRHPTQRGRGRPADADPEQQRQHLLSAAATVFAERGPEATTLQQIARLAAVDRRLLYHYFDSKDNLYVEVLRHHYRNLGQISAQLAVDARSVEQFMELMMRRLFAFCRANPQFVRILAWENLRGAQGLAQMPNPGVDRSVLDKLEPLVEREIAAGRCRDDLDARQLLVSGLAQCFYVLTNRESLALVVHYKPESEADWDRWIDHAVKQTIRGIRP